MKNFLKKDFENRKSFYVNRASAVYPIYFKSPKNDLILSWLNYWTIKNKIDSSTIVVNLRIYDSEGVFFCKKVLTLLPDNNFFSIRSLIRSEKFSGMVEIEIVSSSNLRFAFPAVIGFYKSESLYSCVHSAGRFKGSEENQTPSITEETNWTCKFNEKTSPFFHYINGTSNEDVRLMVNLYASDGSCVNSIEILESFSAHASKIYFIDRLFTDYTFEDGMYVGVACNNDSVFRRMVVGNYHKQDKHLEVTHSFPKQTLSDFCPKNTNGYDSFLAMFSDENLNLEARVFPTNCSNNFETLLAKQTFSSSAIGKPKETSKLSSGYGFIQQPENIRLNLFCFSGGKVPSRLNTNFLYTVRNVQSVFSTDIAAGAKSNVYPPKYSHWGSGVFGNGYDFVLMIRNINHTLDAVSTKGSLFFFGLDETIEHEIEVSGQAASSIVLSNLLNNKTLLNNTKEKIFTWFLRLDQPHSETFWVSFRKTDGCIVGDHGF